MYVAHILCLVPHYYFSVTIEICWTNAAGGAGSENDTNVPGRPPGRMSGTEELGKATYIDAPWETPPYSTH